MSGRFKPHINPKILVWARESASMTIEQAAKKAGVGPARLEAFEAGTDAPTVKQLFKLSVVYQRPFGVFFLPEPPKDFDTRLKDFRRVAGAESRPSSELQLQIRRAIVRRLTALDLYREIEGSDPPRFPVRARLDEEPETVAARLRSHLNGSVDQESWTSPHEALRRWRAAVENAFVLVFQAPGVDPKEARGFSISEHPLPVVVLNMKDAPRGRIFTLFHELAHIMLNDGGLCDLDDRGTSPTHPVEAFCNRVAGASLIPKEDLLSDPGVSGQPADHEWTEEELAELSRRFWVSREAILVRLVSLDRATQEFYERKKPQFEAEHRKYQEGLEESTGGPSVPVKTVSREGGLYTRLVLNRLDAANISVSDVCDYLDFRVRHLGAIRERVFEGSS